MSVWTFAFIVTLVLGLIMGRIAGGRHAGDGGIRGERVRAWSQIIAAGSVVGVAVSAQLSELPISAFRMFCVAATVAIAVATIHHETRRLHELRTAGDERAK